MQQEVPSPGVGFPVFAVLSFYASSSDRGSLCSEYKPTGDQAQTVKVSKTP